MNHSQLLAEGNRLDGALSVAQRIIGDKEAIPEQLRIVQVNAKMNMARLQKIRVMMDADCGVCNHPKVNHLNGTKACLYGARTEPCECDEWEVDL